MRSVDETKRGREKIQSRVIAFKQSGLTRYDVILSNWVDWSGLKWKLSNLVDWSQPKWWLSNWVDWSGPE